ncbi:uncharacterized protein LOC657105 [Tribolium castaneum]|uniref:Uncharacterized protein n=1 Tax=Tribolium castaneum TaxID=7070 RepID=D6WLI9_TRICA|nr:PREDICTED: uncharacterized protein LOC657105 [Tribolium castaneum]EFA03443.1 hypothetical protein TcasGA2_TC013434 [Tribolium castaneum]|eukprot:XP_968678.1 PREDICTED: uncharacterized protein LOC657105 [Tribolium castaneum]
MNLFVATLFLFGFNASLALYPSANYKSVVVERPQEVYGLPHFKVPSIIYGVPSRTFDLDVSDLLVQVSDKEEVLQVPSTSYGVPLQKVAVPSKPSETYGAPTLRATEVLFGGDILAQKLPSTSYGVPVENVIFKKPAQDYGVPTLHSTDFVVVPEKPVVTKIEVPSVEYGVPEVVITKNFETYELPKVRVPVVEYGVPEKPSEEYGVPKVRVPATVYGVPL